jgi:hypothetical protein
MGVDATFQMEGRLPQRPLSPLWEEMERMGCILTRPTADTIRCQGRLRPGTYTIPGNISSQYITGLLFGLSLLDGHSRIDITGKLESEPYVAMTRQTLRKFRVYATPDFIKGGRAYRSPKSVQVEGDCSNAAAVSDGELWQITAGYWAKCSISQPYSFYLVDWNLEQTALCYATDNSGKLSPISRLYTCPTAENKSNVEELKALVEEINSATRSGVTELQLAKSLVVEE